jgi:ATP-binding cassette subfamily C protein CydC
MPKSRQLGLGVALACLEALTAVSLLATSAWLISRAAEHPPIMYLNMAIVGVRGFALGRAFFRYTQRLVLHDASFKLVTALRPAVFKRIAPLAPAGLVNLDHGSSMSAVVHDVEELQNLSVRVVTPLVQAAATSAFVLVGLAVICPGSALSLALTLVASVFIALPISSRLNSKAAEASISTRRELASATKTFVENLDVLVAYEWADNRLGQISEVENRGLIASKRQSLVGGIGSSLFAAFAALATVASAAIGASAVFDGTLSGPMLAVVALVPMGTFEFIGGLQGALQAWQRYKVSADRISAILDSVPSPVIAPNDEGSELSQVEWIEFRDVSLAYPNSTANSVTNLNARLDAGERLLIQGASGSGKTTVAYALSGFLKPHQGQIIVGNQNGEVSLDTIAEQSIRTHIGYLEQRPTIFDGSVRTNLLIAKPDATDDELMAALNKVGLGDTFTQRAGLGTWLGERGLAVSGGEAQRIAVARALLADFKVMIFDEPTANLDAETGGRLWRDLLSMSRERADSIYIFITHDLASFEDAAYSENAAFKRLVI